MEKILEDQPIPAVGKGPGGRRCDTCLAWDSTGNQPGVGICRNGPPTVCAVVVPTPPNILSKGRPGIAVQAVVNYPGTHGNEWCVQWRTKEVLQ